MTGTVGLEDKGRSEIESFEFVGTSASYHWTQMAILTCSLEPDLTDPLMTGISNLLKDSLEVLKHLTDHRRNKPA